MVAYAGELATANGITGWKNGDAQLASIICFNDWIKYRVGTSNQEVNDIITQVKLFIEKYNDSRFRNLSSDTVRVINEMAGYKEEIEGAISILLCPMFLEMKSVNVKANGLGITEICFIKMDYLRALILRLEK